ncbi:MAG: hypothetical protein JNL40_15895 [Cyclobacteriaceae bacterium]|nr:hypothetical protein [Cyclobacteriaceae bacterium]
MTRSRKIFLIAALLFAAFLVFIVVDISRRTTFPGSKKKEKVEPVDTIKNSSSPKSAAHQP